MMTGQDGRGAMRRAQRLQPRHTLLSGLTLEALLTLRQRFGIQVKHLTSPVPFLAPSLHGLLVEIAGLSAGVVVHVPHDDVSSQCMEQVQQHGGIHAATGGNHQPFLLAHPSLCKRLGKMLDPLIHGPCKFSRHGF